MNIRLNSLLVVVVALYAQLAHGQITFPVDRPAVQVGDRWKASALDGFSKVATGSREEVVALVGIDSISTTRKTDGTPSESYLYDLDWNRLSDVKGRIEKEQRYAFPLVLGKTWSASWNWINSRGREGQIEMTYTVAGTERITVPAGTYETVKIEGKGVWKNRSSGSSGVAVETVWYSPIAKRYVRSTWVTRYAGGALDQNTIYEALEVDVKP
ncbi:MAG: hypothetical protein PSV26_14355 [Polaromonas sp.]|uniref:hypothetical protein n=1 Tax=Polaromonas sp. TaxID=1869339 RepID=UPI0024872431|nr:hypothetical protein [Polaromonas sp.]MDI1238660.1 hypothetical protein [Polaromonas sp.]